MTTPRRPPPPPRPSSLEAPSPGSPPPPSGHPGRGGVASAGDHAGRSPVFWVGLVVGWAIIGFGIHGFLSQAHETAPHATVWWILGSAVVHDALVAPVVTTIGLVLAVALPRWAHGPVATGVAASGIVVAFSYPLLRHFGRRADNPSILPLDYPRNVAVVLALIWVVVGLAAAVRWRGERRGA